MGLTGSVCVATGTFGADSWADLARTRAGASVPDDVPWVHAHRHNLMEARNAALEAVKSEWVVFLDADDELEPDYLDRMADAAASNSEVDVWAPSYALYINERGRNRLWQPTVFGHRHRCTGECLREGNWVLIGAMVRTEIVRSVGGFRDFTWSEDYDVWVRCFLAGARFSWAPHTTYRAHVRKASRNRAATGDERLAAHRAIAAANGLPMPGAA